MKREIRKTRDSPALRHMAVMEIIPSSGPPRCQYAVARGTQTSQLLAACEGSHWTLCVVYVDVSQC